MREVLILGNPVLWWAGALALIARSSLWVGARRLALRLSRGRRALDLAALAAQRRPADLQLLRLLLPAVPRARDLLAIGKLLGPARGPSPRRTTG
jgi:dolichyl-phosphate-mannose-protein mannosyltransferase